jgi:ribose-phosphate pyrophosphokinase
MAKAVVQQLGAIYESKADVLFLADIDSRFSDSETIVRLDHGVSGCDVFLFQALYDPVVGNSINGNYVALLIAARACREWGANHVTAVLPYLAYGRQDKPAPFRREPTSAKLLADMTIVAGVDRLVTWHPHLRQIHGFYGSTPVHALDALPYFTTQFQRYKGRNDVVVVAPDVGASKFVTYFGRALEVTCAIGSKYRPRPEEAVVSEIIGNLRGKKTAIVLDDMISSGGTVRAAVDKLSTEASIDEVQIAVSHNLCLPAAKRQLEELYEEGRLAKVTVTNTIPQTSAFAELPFLDVYDVSPVLADLVYKVHHNQPVTELFFGPEWLESE